MCVHIYILGRLCAFGCLYMCAGNSMAVCIALSGCGLLCRNRRVSKSLQKQIMLAVWT